MARSRKSRTAPVRHKARAGTSRVRSSKPRTPQAQRARAPSYFRLDAREKTVWHRAFRTLTRMEKGASLSKAARKEHTTPRAVRKYMGSRLKVRRGHWELSTAYYRDHPLNVRVMTEEGFRIVSISDPSTRSKYARYLSYVNMSFSDNPEVRRRGTDGLVTYEGRTFKDADGNKHPYITDRRLLTDMEDAGKLDIPSFYEQMAK